MAMFVMSDIVPEFCRAFETMGHRVVAASSVEIFYKPERKHADMQLLTIGEKIIELREADYGFANTIKCEKSAEQKYPGNVLLNCLLLNNKLYGKLRAVDKAVLKLCESLEIETINVNQGYTRCSTLVINDRAAITSDISIKNALESNGVEVFLISPGNIFLDGFDYGFIGGAGVSFDGKTVFFGNVKKHPDYEKIRVFCKKYNSKLEILCEHIPLTDIGGAVRIC